jgi:hypothetical protein
MWNRGRWDSLHNTLQQRRRLPEDLSICSARHFGLLVRDETFCTVSTVRVRMMQPTLKGGSVVVRTALTATRKLHRDATARSHIRLSGFLIQMGAVQA